MMLAFNPVLHGLRSIAACAVLLFHWVLLFPSLPNALDDVEFLGTSWNLTFQFGFGWLGVPLFFVLSGYLLGSQLADRNISAMVIAKFWKRRFFRIYPAVWAQTIFLLFVAFGYFPALAFPDYFSALTLSDIIRNLFLWINLPPWMIRPAISTWWTLPVELAFYLLLPFIILLVRKFGLTTIIVVSFVTTIAWRFGFMMLYKGENYSDHLYILDSIPGVLSTFVAGVSLAYLHVKFSMARRRLILLILATAFLAMQYWLVANIGSYWSGHWMLAIWNPLMAIIIALGVYCFLLPTGKSSILGNKYLVFFGEISFGLYLWHLPVQGWISSFLPGNWSPLLNSGLALALTFALTVPIASLSYYFIERPIMGWGKSGPAAHS